MDRTEQRLLDASAKIAERSTTGEVSDAMVERACRSWFGDAWISPTDPDFAKAELRADFMASMRRTLEAAALPVAAPMGGDDMLPDALMPHADEWYRLCERRFSAERITISGQLAEAIVIALTATPAPPPAMQAEIDRLRADAASLREALEFYVDSDDDGERAASVIAAIAARARDAGALDGEA